MNRHFIHDLSFSQQLQDLSMENQFTVIWELLQHCLKMNIITNIYSKLEVCQIKTLFSKLYCYFRSKQFDISACIELKARSCRPGYRHLNTFLVEVGVHAAEIKEEFKTNPQERDLLESYILVGSIIIIKVASGDEWEDTYDTSRELFIDFPQFQSESKLIIHDLLLFANTMKNVLRYVRASV